ncbi:hypothetical protein CYJ76_02690 [Kytococcus schroeteri]|uniref:Uncharacterized protein n=1 Tax=Kytococcus schroeteri TaxID=138300 RepID=A0A2I1PCY3_9MICO|nr:hypothetical protein [Kytococcus schroeteri]PKZ42476.1 hypothetical protein CYJ76_02690 [Kytococcus schroeteri]
MITRTEPHFFLQDKYMGNGLVHRGGHLETTDRRTLKGDLTSAIGLHELGVPVDIIGTVVHDSFKNAIEAIGATGVTFHELPPPSEKVQAIKPGAWWGLEITGTSPAYSDDFHDEHVRVVRMPAAWTIESYCTDPTPQGWDGSDVYHPGDTGYQYVTQRVANALTTAGVDVRLVEVGRHPHPVWDTEQCDNQAEAWRQRMGVDFADWPDPGCCPELLRPATT